MSTSSKHCLAPQKQQTREEPATPPPPAVPVFAKMPCPRDQKAYGLHLEGHTQRWIAGKLKCTQPTVLRGIRRMSEWLAKTLPEDRGEFTGTEKLRLALARHEMLMVRLNRMSVREFRRSRKTIPMKKTITTKDGKDKDGEPVKIRIEEWNKPQIGRKGFLDAAARTSHELTVLAAGHLGQGNGSIAMAEAMDPEERDRWDQMVQRREAKIKDLEASQAAEPAAEPVSKSDEKEPAVNQETAPEDVATSSGPRPCENFTNASSPQIEEPKNLYQDPVEVPPSGGLQQPAQARSPAKSCREAIRRSHRKCALSRKRKCPEEKEFPGERPSATRPAQPSRLVPHVPSSKQQSFLDLNCLEAFYGGAAGGGKSEALLMAALQHVHQPGYAALILRKDTQRLQLAGGLIPRSLEWLAGKETTWNANRRQWTFPTGGAPATLTFGYLAHPLDKYRYGSSEFQFIGFDELTEFTEEDYLFLFSRLRKVKDLNVPLRMRSASNPGGVGHVWVKARFVERGERSEGRGLESGQRSEGRGQEEESGQNEAIVFSSSSLTSALYPLPTFIPARIADNPGLCEEEYRRSLAHLPPVLRERLMNGDWSVQEEGVFRQDWLRYYDVVGQATSLSARYADKLTACPTEQLEIREGSKVAAAIRAANCRRFCTIDPAGTSADKARESRGRPASYSAIQIWDQPRAQPRLLFLRHAWRGRVGFEGLVKIIREIHRTWRPERLWIENERLGQAAENVLAAELPLETISTAGRDKITRAAPLILQMERGEILLPRVAPWLHDFESELLSWTGRDDQPCDQIDAAAYAAIVGQTHHVGVLTIEPVVAR